MNITYKELKTVAGKSMVQITTLDERWYMNDKKEIKPSTTWICSYYPKGVAYYKWLAEHGWDEAESLKKEAGEKGSKIHQIIDKLIDGKTIKMDDKFINNSTKLAEELLVEEWEAIMSFKLWFDETKPEIVDNEFITEAKDYAGTVDILYKDKDGKYHLLDIKSSQYIWKSSELQVSAYKKSVEDEQNIKIDFVEILQVGYRRNKAGYKLTIIDNLYDLFRNTYAIWHDANKDISPKQKDYPMELKLEVLMAKDEKQKLEVKKTKKVKITKKVKKIKKNE